jgi:hypothetical protein
MTLSLLWQRSLPRRGDGRSSRQAGPDLPGPQQSRRAGLPLQSGLSRLSRQARLPHARRTGSRRRTRLRPRVPLQTRLLRTTVLPLQAGTARRILPALDLPLADDPASKVLRGVDLTHKTLVAQRLLRRNQQRDGGKAPAGAGPDGEATGALRQKA